jgi:hypothetical protein
MFPLANMLPLSTVEVIYFALKGVGHETELIVWTKRNISGSKLNRNLYRTYRLLRCFSDELL